MKTSCPFLDIPPERVNASNEFACATPDAYPISPGHTLIVPRRHVASWFDATHEEQQAIWDLVARMKAELDHDRRPDGYNIGINIGEAAGQTIAHLHVHLIPRYTRDVDDPRGGVRYAIPDKGNYKAPGKIPKSGGGAK